MNRQSVTPQATESKTLASFDLLTHQFQQGSTLIEASAGTGKTFSIAMLVLRLVVEQDIPIEKILVVTFTKAATEELKERVRARLANAHSALNGALITDTTLQDWMATIDVAVALPRVTKALADIDQAGIFTIHSFCQRVLQDYPLESGQSFSVELVGDVSAVKHQVVQDFWRRQFYERTEQEVTLLLTHFRSPHALGRILEVVDHPNLTVEPKVTPLDDDLKALVQLKTEIKDWLSLHHERLTTFIADGIKNEWISKNKINKLNTYWAQVVDRPSQFFEYVETAFKKAFQPKINQLLSEIAVPKQRITALDHAAKGLTISIQQALLEDYFNQLNAQLAMNRQMSFDHLILNLANALKTDHKDYLIQQVGAQYQAALIDEFQDTDADQWHIFSTLFNDRQHYLYLIGDPKQAIYKFRGADIYAYLEASRNCQYHYTLDTNWRSVPNMVEAVNSLFQQRKYPFMMEGLTFHPVKAGKTGKEDESALIWWKVPEPPEAFKKKNKKEWLAEPAKHFIRRSVVAEITRQLVQGAEPKDFAILVRSHSSAQAYQHSLAQHGIPSVLNSRTSVFSSEQAMELLYVLRALAEPSSMSKAKQALSVNWFGHDGQSLYDQLTSQSFEDWLDSLFELHQKWQTQSMMSAVFTLLDRYQVRETLARYPDGERRVTNLLHLLELVQSAVLSEHLSLMQTLAFLERKIAEPSTGDEDILRLETDDTAVQIVTMHAAKGLQYKIVFCPELWRESKLWDKTPALKLHENGKIVVDLGSPQLDHRKKQALIETQAEDLRLAYVALTRAEEKTYVVYGDELEGFDRSPLGYLVGKWHRKATDNFADITHDLITHDSPEDNIEALEQEGNNEFNDYIPFSLPSSLTHHNSHQYVSLELEPIQVAYSPTAQQINYHVKPFDRKTVDTRYRLFSFTGLSKYHAPEIPVDKAEEADIPAIEHDFESHKADIALLPKGSHFGNLVHDILEVNDFATLAQAVNADHRDQLASKYGVKWDARNRTEDQQRADFDAMIQKVVTTPLSPDDAHFTLSAISAERTLKELHFFYAIPSAHTQPLNQLLKTADVPFMPLSPQQIEGYLNGFIDLIVEYQGQFYVMDYKTNFLGNHPEHYAHRAMHEEMTHHSYGLQFMLYSLAVHRYLSYRLPDYDYDRHFGGIKYLFVRGMDGCTSTHGVYSFKPKRDLIDALAHLLQEQIHVA